MHRRSTKSPSRQKIPTRADQSPGAVRRQQHSNTTNRSHQCNPPLSLIRRQRPAFLCRAQRPNQRKDLIHQAHANRAMPLAGQEGAVPVPNRNRCHPLNGYLLAPGCRRKQDLAAKPSQLPPTMSGEGIVAPETRLLSGSFLSR